MLGIKLVLVILEGKTSRRNNCSSVGDLKRQQVFLPKPHPENQPQQTARVFQVSL